MSLLQIFTLYFRSTFPSKKPLLIHTITGFENWTLFVATGQACCRHQQNNKYLIFPDQQLLSLTWHDKQQGLDGKSYLLNLPCLGKQITFVLALGILNYFFTVLTFFFHRILGELGWFSPHLDVLERGCKFDWAKFSTVVQQQQQKRSCLWHQDSTGFSTLGPLFSHS